MTTLPERSDSVNRTAPLVHADGPRAARRVQSKGTTATGAVDKANPEWSADLEYVWRNRMRPQLDNWTKRARAARRRGDRTRAEYAKARARAIGLPRYDVVDACRGRWRVIGCGCGPRDVVVGCDQPQICAWCAKRHWWRWRKRITRALRTHLRAARAAWSAGKRRGKLPGVYLVTLTGPHSGDLVEDRKRLGAAWRKLTKVAQREQWWSTYAATYECTPGTDGNGHMHMHVAAVSSWIPYEELHAAWRAAMPGAVVLDVRAPTSRSEAAAAANYLSKYVTKGVQLSELRGAKAGELLVAFRGRRKVTTSSSFWKDPGCCLTCRRKFYLRAAPIGLQRHAPGAVLRSMAEQARYWIARGDPQVALILDGSCKKATTVAISQHGEAKEADGGHRPARDGRGRPALHL